MHVKISLRLKSALASLCVLRIILSVPWELSNIKIMFLESTFFSDLKCRIYSDNIINVMRSLVSGQESVIWNGLLSLSNAEFGFTDPTFDNSSFNIINSMFIYNGNIVICTRKDSFNPWLVSVRSVSSISQPLSAPELSQHIFYWIKLA
jgi:hypothetical protein